MSTHTPGPWTLETVPTSAGSVHKIGPFPSQGVRNETYACVYADQQRIGIDDANKIAAELRANARLIAAAPDLLAALRKIIGVNARIRHGEVDYHGAWADCEAIARAAIAKAEGKA